MNLIQRIIVWLATRFLTNGKVVDLFIEKILAKDGEDLTLRTLFNRHNNTVSGKKKNLNFWAMNHLYATFGTAELAKLLFFKAIKEQRTRCADAFCDEGELNELLALLRDNNASNPMKRLANFKQILRTALPFAEEQDIVILAQIAMYINHSLVANNQFLKEI